ncbi:MAG: PspC domain-containing protein [Candidatus Dojkabacteria bacterium]
MESKRLFRSEKNRVIAGVCGGLADYLSIDVNIVRVVFLAGLFFGVGTFFWIYLILWVVVPTESQVANENNDTIKKNIEEIKAKVSGLLGGKKAE